MKKKWILTPSYLPIIKPSSDDAHPFSPLPSACFLPWHLLFAQLLTMFADPTTQNDELLKGKSNLISKFPNYQFHPALPSLQLAGPSTAAWNFLQCPCAVLHVPVGMSSRLLLTRCDGSPESLSCTPEFSSRFCLEPRSVPFDKLLHCQCSHHLEVTLYFISHPIASWRSQNPTGERNL